MIDKEGKRHKKSENPKDSRYYFGLINLED